MSYFRDHEVLRKIYGPVQEGDTWRIRYNEELNRFLKGDDTVGPPTQSDASVMLLPLGVTLVLYIRLSIVFNYSGDKSRDNELWKLRSMHECHVRFIEYYSKTCLKRNAIVRFFPFSQVSVLQRVVF
jgi:hypothetical protein